MRQQDNRRGWPRASLIVITVVALWWLATAVLDAMQLSKARLMSEEIFKPNETRTVCFGRMIFDLPKGAKLKSSLYRYPGGYKEIHSAAKVADADFMEIVRSFEQQLKSTKHERDPSLLKKIINVPGNSSAKIFVHWEKDYSEHLTMLTGFSRLSDGTQYKFVSEVSSEFVDEMSRKLIATLTQLRPRPVNRIPSEHGFCLGTAFIPDQLKGEDFERTELYFDVEPWVGVSILVKTFVNQVKEPASLLKRFSLSQRHPDFAQTYSLIRSGTRESGGLRGEEVLALVKEEKERYFQFRWEVEGEVHRNDPPDIKVDLLVSQDGKPGEMTKEQALALWEYLLPRLRLRPVSATSSAVSDTSKRAAPLGERHVTGHRCPQSGWWECDDQLDLAQHSGLWLETGQLMPMALVWREPSVWQRLKGERPVGKTPAVWRLAAYEAPADTAPAKQPSQGEPP